MNCENCNNEHDGKYGSGRFCGSDCARGFSTKAKRQEINEKVSSKLKRNLQWNDCLFCGKRITAGKRRKKFCNNSCSVRHRVKYNKNYLKRLSESAKKAIKRREDLGLPCGWMIHKNKPSYAETFFMTVFKNKSIKYEYNKKCGRYLIDFVIGKSFALEIDGSQHEWSERKASDLRKDEYLKSKGYNIHRIKWKEINSIKGKEYIKEEINKLFSITCV